MIGEFWVGTSHLGDEEAYVIEMIMMFTEICKFLCYFCAAEKPEDPFIPGPEPLGFFPPPHRKRPPHLFVADNAHRLPPADGFIPNSVLVHLLFPEKTETEEEEAYRPPGLTDSQIESINQFKQSV